MWHCLGGKEMHSGFWGRDLKEENHFECRWQDNIKMDLKEAEC